MSVDIENEREADLLVRPFELIPNHDLGYQGRLDGVATENGALVPMEIKSHRRVLRSDRTELAFYWRLLEPLREGNFDSKDYIVLSDGVRVEVELKKGDFNKLDFAVAEVRRIREEGTELAIVPECKSCVYSTEYEEIVWKNGDLSLVRNIGRPRRDWLLRLRITNVGDLAEADLEQLWNDWALANQYAPGKIILTEMQAHAKALVSGDVQFIGDEGFPFLDSGILLDLEYDSGRHAFVVGVAVFQPNQEPSICQWFAKGVSEEGQILESLSQMLAEFPDFWIITWNGKSADVPQLR